MRVKIFPSLGQEFVSLSWEGNGEGTVEDETRDLFARFSDWLRQFGLTLDHTVRTRMWVRDLETWHAGVIERARILSGRARSVSSSHVRPVRLGSKARMLVDLNPGPLSKGALFLSRASLSVHAQNRTDLRAMADDLFKVHIRRI